MKVLDSIIMNPSPASVHASKNQPTKTPQALNAVVLQVEKIQSTQTGFNIEVPAHYHICVGQLLLAENVHGQRAFLQVEEISPSENPNTVWVVAPWANKQPVANATLFYWVDAQSVLTAANSQFSSATFPLSDVFCPEVTLSPDHLLASTFVQSTNKLVLAETLVTLLMQLRSMGKFPVVLDVLGLFKQLDLPNIPITELGEAGNTFYSIETYGIETLMGDCIAQMPQPLQAGGWAQYAHAFGNVTHPIEDLKTLNTLLEKSGAGLLYKQFQRLEQRSLFAKEPQATYFSVEQLVNQAPHAALWVIDLSSFSPAVLPWLANSLTQEITDLSVGKDQLALALLNADYQANVSQVLNPENNVLQQANLPFVQGQWRKKKPELSLEQSGAKTNFNLTIELLSPEKLVLLQGDITQQLLLVLGLPPITPLDSSRSIIEAPPAIAEIAPQVEHQPVSLPATPELVAPKTAPVAEQSAPPQSIVETSQPETAPVVAPQVEHQPVSLPATPELVAPKTAPVAEQPAPLQPIFETSQPETAPVVAPPVPVKSSEEVEEDGWIYAAAQGSAAIHLMEAHSNNRFNTGAIAREFLLQEQGVSSCSNETLLFEPLPLSVNEVSPEAQAKNRTLNNLTANEEDLPPLDMTLLPDVELPASFTEEEERNMENQAEKAGEYYNSILGQMPAHWRTILERELKKEAVIVAPKTGVAHSEAYPDELVATKPLQPGEIALTEEIVANTHALHPCLPDDMMVDIESFYPKTEEQPAPQKPDAPAIPTSHLSGFLEAHLLDNIDEPEMAIDLVGSSKTDWYAEASAQTIAENVIDFSEEALPVPTPAPVNQSATDLDLVPDFQLEAPSHSTPILEPETQFIAEANHHNNPSFADSAALMSQIFDGSPTVTMDGQLLHQAQAPLVAGHPQGQWAVKSVDALPEEIITPSIEPANSSATYGPPTNQSDLMMVVDQDENASFEVSLPVTEMPYLSPEHAVVTHPETETSNGFPMFEFDMNDLPEFGTNTPTATETHLPTPQMQQPFQAEVVAQQPAPVWQQPETTQTVTVAESLPISVAPEPSRVEPAIQPNRVEPEVANAPPDWQGLSNQLDSLTSGSEPMGHHAGSVKPDSSPFAQPDPAPITPEAPEAPEAPAPAPPEQSLEKISVGNRVRHNEYGIGTVQAVVPLEERSVVSILFDTQGRRLLDPSLSALYPV